MSFSQDVKKELAGIDPGKKCCRLALLTGFIRFAGTLTIESGRIGLRVSTDSPATARCFITNVREYFGSKAKLQITDSRFNKSGHSYKLDISPEMNSEMILREVGILGIQEGSNYIRDELETANFKKRCCKRSVLRGIFLAAGSISDPVKSYHLEIVCSSKNIASDLKKLINSFDLNSKITFRREKYVVYIKEAEQISLFLSVLGCSSSLFRFEDVRMSKEMKNEANRGKNCDDANARRAADAAFRTRQAILLIKEKRGLETLPPRLRETAEKRLNDDAVSLSDLCLCFDPPLTKSGLNHRLAKLEEIAAEIKAETD